MNTGIKLTVLLSTCCLSLSAQENSFYAGIRLGGGYSINNHIDRILVSENYYSNYSFDNKGLFVPSAELFFLYREPGSLCGVEAGIAYYNKTARVRYEDRNELNYTLSTRYHHLGLAAYLNLYPFRGQEFPACFSGRKNRCQPISRQSLLYGKSGRRKVFSAGLSGRERDRAAAQGQTERPS